jgi:hypothetical protein
MSYKLWDIESAPLFPPPYIVRGIVVQAFTFRILLIEQLLTSSLP